MNRYFLFFFFFLFCMALDDPVEITRFRLCLQFDLWIPTVLRFEFGSCAETAFFLFINFCIFFLWRCVVSTTILWILDLVILVVLRISEGFMWGDSDEYSWVSLDKSVNIVFIDSLQFWFMNSDSPANFRGIHVNQQLCNFSGWFSVIIQSIVRLVFLLSTDWRVDSDSLQISEGFMWRSSYSFFWVILDDPVTTGVVDCLHSLVCWFRQSFEFQRDACDESAAMLCTQNMPCGRIISRWSKL